jgi:UDP-2,3-diacylglucosamine hydrolase
MRPKLGIVAGGGELPGLAAAACHADGRPFHVLALTGHADPRVIGDWPQDWIRLGEAGTGMKKLHDAGVAEVVMIGPVRRPTLKELAPDLRTARFFARIGLKALGDDGLLRAVVAEMEEEGFRVVGIDEVLADCLAPAGPYGRLGPDAQAEADIARAVEVAKALGALDVGQAVVVQQGIVLGVEAIEGTDRLLRRCGELRRDGPGGILVKLKKPGQDRRVDLPTIGPTTLVEAAAAGLSGIAVEAGGALVLGRAALAAEADRLGMFVIGIEPC